VIRSDEENQLIPTNSSVVGKEQIEISPSDETLEGINPYNLKPLMSPID
jgi:hypothetical protein